jgi:hypothetical protein
MNTESSKRGQVQNHGPRARAGSPELVERIALWCTEKQRRAVRRNGGSIWVRKLIDEATR